MSRKRAGKPLPPELHIPLADLDRLSASDLLAISGPRFITSDSEPGARIYAVLISHDKWRTLNHALPEVDPEKARPFYVGNSAYVVIPCEPHIGSVLRPKPSTGLEIIYSKSPRKQVTQ